MENSNLTFVLMAGLPGSGKTTIAEELGRDLHWHVIDKDGYKEKFEAYNRGSEDPINMAYEKAFEEARFVLAEHHTSVIFDSAVLDDKSLERAREVVRNYKNVQLKIILCIVPDPKMREERLRERPPKDLTIKADPANRAEYLQYFRHLPPPPDTLSLDTDKPLVDCIYIARQYLKQ